MCGLIGATGKFESRYLVALGCLSESRGKDSAGVAWQVSDRLRIAKIAQNPLVAYPVTLAPAIRHAAKYGGPLIGHTRAATTGAVTNQNAHPFYDKTLNIAWAHNGIIYNHHKFGNYSVDSESLIEGIKKKDFAEFSGPIALLWIEGGKLHAFRKGNPLYRGTRREGVYLASEEDMLAEIGCKRIKELSEGHLYIWNQNTLEGAKTIPCNKSSYSTYIHTPYYDGYGEDWNNREKRWQSRAPVTDFPPSGSGSGDTVIGGCSSGGSTRQAGFRFTHSCPKGNGCPDKGKEEESDAGTTSETPAIVDASKEGISEDSGEPLRHGPIAMEEPDTLAEADAAATGETAEEEIADMERLCSECQTEPRMLGETQLCHACFSTYINIRNHDH